MQVITTTQDLQEFCKNVENQPFITVDTEFIRDKTYWPKLCLIQVASEEDAVIIDPLAENMDLAPLYEVFKNPKITKVFHAGRHDIEIFYHEAKVLPAPVFDTQIAAMVCGFGESTGYQALVKSLLGKKINKEMRFTDWQRRPLDKRQLDYALSDVTHLRDVYKKLQDHLVKHDRFTWFEEEEAALLDPATYEIDPYKTYERIRARSHNRAFLAIIRELSAWREIEAQRRDVPRLHLLRDEALLEIASYKPTTVKELQSLRLVGRRGISNETGEKVLDALQKGMTCDANDYPQLPKHEHLVPTDQQQAIIELLRVLLKFQAAKHEVAPSLLCSSSDLTRLVLKPNEDHQVLKGWRKDVFGKIAVDLIEGRITLGADKKGIKIINAS